MTIGVSTQSNYAYARLQNEWPKSAGMDVIG